MTGNRTRHTGESRAVLSKSTYSSKATSSRRGQPAVTADLVVEAYRQPAARGQLAGARRKMADAGRYCECSDCAPATARSKYPARRRSRVGCRGHGSRARFEQGRKIDAQSGGYRARSRAAQDRSEFDGRLIHNASPADIVAAGLVHVPEGRRIFPNMSVADNLDLGSYPEGKRRERKINRERVFSIFPRLPGARRSARRHAFGWRTADALQPSGRGLMAEPKLC